MLKKGNFVIMEKCIGVKGLFFQPKRRELIEEELWGKATNANEKDKPQKKKKKKLSKATHLLYLLVWFYLIIHIVFQQQKIAVLLKLQAMDLQLAIWLHIRTRCSLSVMKALICEDRKQDSVCQLGIGAETKVSVKVLYKERCRKCGKRFEIVLVIAAIIFPFLAVNCGRLSSPMNGSISGNLTVYPNIFKFSCDPGFILRGSPVRKCQSNGTWHGYETTCEGKMPKTMKKNEERTFWSNSLW